jgi:hypothetical protein
MFSIFRHPLIKRHLFENITRYIFMCCLSPAASVFCMLLCVARMDVGVVLLSCFYVPHCYVCLYAVGVVERVSIIVDKLDSCLRMAEYDRNM